MRDRLRIPHAKVAFEEYEMNIDLSQFNNVNLEEENITTSFRMQKINQLQKSIDTLQTNFEEEQTVFSYNFSKQSAISNSARKNKKILQNDSIPSDILGFVIMDENWKKVRLYDESINKLKKSLRDLKAKNTQFFAFQKLINLHKITLHEKYTLLFVSLFLFLIGASLGAIIRKGGIGLPLVLSIIIFLTYHYIGLFSKNAAEDNSIPPFFATWIATLILAPFSYPKWCINC